MTMRGPVKSKKLTLSAIRDRQYFDLSMLAEHAGVDLSVIHRVLNNQPIQRYQAELVLSALADGFGEDYTLETVALLLLPEDRSEEA